MGLEEKGGAAAAVLMLYESADDAGGHAGRDSLVERGNTRGFVVFRERRSGRTE